MAKFKKYGYPLFMGASGLLTTVSDLIQKNEIAVTLAAFLAVVGIITIVTPLNVQQRVFRIVSDGVDEGFSSRAFGTSCLFLAAAVFGFSTLSAKAAPEGGIIASQYPEIHQLQMKLGVIEQATARIEDKTDQLLTATRHWVSITEVATWHGETNNLHLRIENNTPFFFKKLNGTVKTSNNEILYLKDIGLGSDGIHLENFDILNDSLDTISLCIIGERTSDGAIIKETQHYRKGRNFEINTNYILDDVDGPTIVDRATKCEL